MNFVPGIMEKLDSNLWHTITLPAGDYSGVKYFFGGSSGEDTNVFNYSLPVDKNFRIKKISLMPARDAYPPDVDRLLSNSDFKFGLSARNYYEGPAQTFFKGDSAGINDILLNLKKMPKKVQQAILQNLKVPAGFELSNSFELLALQCFRATLETPNVIRFEKPVKITCLLEGLLLRTGY